MGKQPKSFSNVRHQPVATHSKRLASRRAEKKAITDSTNKDSTKCGYCQIDHKTFEKLHSHVCYPFQCLKCSRTFKYDFELNIHETHQHIDKTEEISSQSQMPSVEVLTCDSCNYTCETPELLSEHKLTHYKKTQKCVMCKTKICFKEENKYCKTCSIRVLDTHHKDYSLRRNFQLNDISSIPSTSGENPLDNGGCLESRQQLETMSNLPSLQAKESNSTSKVIPFVKIAKIDSVITSKRKINSKIQDMSKNKKICQNLNSNLSSRNVKLTKNNKLKDTASLKTNASNRKCLPNHFKETASTEITSAHLRAKKNSNVEPLKETANTEIASAHPRAKKNSNLEPLKETANTEITSAHPRVKKNSNVESSKTASVTSKSATNKSNYTSKNVITKKRKKKNDSIEVASTESKLSSNIPQTELPEKEIKANLNSVSKSSTKSIPDVKTTKDKIQNSSEENSSSIFSTNVEYIINSLPDTDSGILLKSSKGTDTIYKCVRCHKILKLNIGYMHFSSCKARYRNLRICMNDLTWLCTHCSLAFEDISELLKHKQGCSAVLTEINSKNVDTENSIQLLKEYNNDDAYNYICRICNYKCMSKKVYESHSCQQEILKKKAVVFLDQPRKLDLEPSQKVPYYQCRDCRKTSMEMHCCRSHIKENHPDKDENNFTSLSVTFRRKIFSNEELNRNFTTKKIKQERDKNYTVNNVTTSDNGRYTLSGNVNTNSSLQDNFSGFSRNNSAARINTYIPNVMRSSKVYECTCKSVSVLPNDDQKPCLKCHKMNACNVIQKLRATLLPKNTDSLRNKTLIDQTNKNQSKDPTSIGSSQQTSSSSDSFVNHHPRSFPTPPTTPENSFCHSPKDHVVESGRHFTTCPPTVPVRNICDPTKTQELPNDTSVPFENSVFDNNIPLRGTIHSTFDSGISANLNPPTHILDPLKNTNEKIFHPPENHPSLIYDVQNLTHLLMNDSNSISQLSITHDKELPLSSDAEFSVPNVLPKSSILDVKLLSSVHNVSDIVYEVKNDPFTLKYSWNFDRSDFIAFVPSYENRTVWKYICSKCLLSVNTDLNEICRHVQLDHNQTSGDINILYDKLNQSNYNAG